MLKSAIKETELEKIDIILVKNILEIGIQDDYADKISADYIDLARAKSDKNSLLYKSSKVKECYRQSDLHKSINRIIYKIEPLRVSIMREGLALQQAVAEGNKEIADEIIKVVVRMKLEKSKLEKNLSALMGNVKKLQLAS
ncbi:hypothetical protein [Psychrobacter cibarius]|uniref:hypothetical protein n=1 Tax=Psychrobacter cibarius TaxID=282669 RepID=UPI00191948E1|nr:hypothetical protein [Psychrobacter cibarius]